MSDRRKGMVATGSEIIAYLLEKSADRQFVAGPVVWCEDVDPPYYVVVSSGDVNKEWHADQIGLGYTHNEADETAAGLVTLFASHDVVIHWFDDELEAAKFCEILWPGPRLSAVRRKMELERVHHHPEPAGRQ